MQAQLRQWHWYFFYFLSFCYAALSPREVRFSRETFNSTLQRTTVLSYAKERKKGEKRYIIPLLNASFSPRPPPHVRRTPCPGAARSVINNERVRCRTISRAPRIDFASSAASFPRQIRRRRREGIKRGAAGKKVWRSFSGDRVQTCLPCVSVAELKNPPAARARRFTGIFLLARAISSEKIIKYLQSTRKAFAQCKVIRPLLTKLLVCER